MLVSCAVIAIEVALAGAGLAFAQPGDPDATNADPPGLQRRGVSAILRGGGPSAVDHTGQVDAIRDLLAARAAAVTRRDRDAFLATVDPAAAEFQRRQGELFDNLAGVPVDTWAYEVDPRRETPLPPGLSLVYGDDLWAPKVRLRYSLAGFDTTPTTQDQQYLFVRHGERWYLADDGRDTAPAAAAGNRGRPGTGTVRNLWDFGPVVVSESARVLVLGHPGDERLIRRVQAAAAAAVPRVTEVWGPQWPQRVVVLVPHDPTELAYLVEEPGDTSRIAAFASADVLHPGPPSGKRVVVNPGVFGDLQPVGQQVVVTHEITHVAARDVTSAATPHWLAEGLADYVAYRDTAVTDRSAARELSLDVQAGHPPANLPRHDDFAADAPRLPQAYGAAWMACRLIVDRAGEQALVRIYQRVSAASDPAAELDAALHAELGLGTTAFEARWRDYLVEKLG